MKGRAFGCGTFVLLALLILPRAADATSPGPNVSEVQLNLLVVVDGPVAEALFVAEQVLENAGYWLVRRTLRTTDGRHNFTFEISQERLAGGWVSFSADLESGQMILTSAGVMEKEFGEFDRPEMLDAIVSDLMARLSSALEARFR